MLHVNIMRDDRARVEEGLRKRNFSEDQLALVDRVIQLDDVRKATQTGLDEHLSKVNKYSKEIGALFKNGQKDKANVMRELVASEKDHIKMLEGRAKEVEVELKEALFLLPNIPHHSVAKGDGDDDNEVVQDWDGAWPTFEGFAAEPHWELASRYNLIDFKLGVKITGSGFPLFRGKGAQLERALINFFLDEARLAGYEEVAPPLLVNEDSATATGQLPDKEGQMYHTELDNLYLIPTAEVPVTNIFRDEIVDFDELPIKLTAYTPCFRREAGSYGADVKGLNRVHQFDKVEIVQFALPSTSYEILQEMVEHVKSLLLKLELPFRILRLCGGDLGFTSALTFDFEVYSAAQEKWLEVSSVSNFESFQSNRLKVRYRKGKEKPQLVHTLNGSALALARIVAAILENNQTAKGINIPEVLHKYTGFTEIS
ncbi:MAG: serine--tRNA ligase [Saprospiraceae bacterium]|nr:serine--tRNA ligase [Saprospiraceae bacterium]